MFDPLMILVNTRPSPIQSLPAETLLEIFRYLRFPNVGNWKTGKRDLYSAALVCRTFSRLAVPMLWENLIFTVNNKRGRQQPYQEKFLEILTHESASNFVHTRELTLHFSLVSVIITEINQCATIKSTIDNLVMVFEHAAPYLRRLNMKIEPFIPSDCQSDETLWASLNSCNNAIYHCLGVIAHREIDFPIFHAEIGRDSWAFDVEYRQHLQQILWLLAPRITILEMSESPYFLNDWFPLMQRMRALRINNVGSANTDYAEAMWTAIAALPLSELLLNGFKFPSRLRHNISRSLTQVWLVGVDDVVAACVVFFTQLPQLKKCGLNWGKEKNPVTDRSVVIKDTVCAQLLEVYLIDSVVPVGLVSVIAMKNPQLHYVSAPPNISDNDIINLRRFCPRLRDLAMSSGPLDRVRPTIRMSENGFAELQHLRALQTLTVHDSDVGHFQEKLLTAIAENCSVLHLVQFWIPNEQRGTWTEADVRARLVGSDVFKDHILSIADFGSIFWSVPLAAFRSPARAS